MSELWRQVIARFWIARQRYIIRLLMAMLALMISVYSAVFYLLMRALEYRPVSVWESVYWTINRLSTTGELPPHLNYTAAPIQALSVLAQMSGLAFMFAVFPLAIIPALERGLLGMPVPLGAMRGHTVVFGFSPVVESLINELAAGSHPFLVVDDDLEVVRRLRRRGIRAIHASPTDDEAMSLAQAATARHIIANREDEEDNAKIVLAASSVSDAEVFALVDDLAHAHYFRYAGATQVLSPKRLLGTYLAHKAATSWKDELYGAHELAAGFYLVELPVYPGSPFDGLRLREAKIPQRTGARLIGILHRGKLEIEPGSDSLISVENVLVAVGAREQLLKLQELTVPVDVPEFTQKRHFVIAGFGDVGQASKEVLDQRGIEVKIIDPRVKDGDYLRGDATNEDTLRLAGIETASTFIVAGHLDRDNIFSVLVARRANPDLHIVARANSRATIDHLYRAGADFVFSLSTIAGQMLAEMLIGDGIITLAEGWKIANFPVGPSLNGREIGQARIRTLTGCTIVAVVETDDVFHPNPGPEYRLSAGMSIVVMGAAEHIMKFKRRFQ